MIRRPPRSPLFPSTTLFRSSARPVAVPAREQDLPRPQRCSLPRPVHGVRSAGRATAVRECFPAAACPARVDGEDHALDRKSTRLNSSHGYISYAVFCLQKTSLTERLRLGAGGDLLPLRAPAVAANGLSSLDCLCRVRLGRAHVFTRVAAKACLPSAASQ